MTEVVLPAGTHYANTWGIPDNYAGMTNALLHRSRAFVRLGGAEITILTYEHRDDYDAVRQRLRDRGAMIDGMHLRNLWEDLRGWDDGRLAEAIATADTTDTTELTPLGGDASVLRREAHDDDGAVRQIDYHRPDGTLLLSDRRDVPGDQPKRVTLCDTAGRPLGSWYSIWSLYHAWLDSLPRDPVAWIIVDSKTTANHMIAYRRDDVVTMHVVHGSHRAGEGTRDEDPLRGSRERVMRNLDAWDVVAFLTAQQLNEVEELLGPGENRYVVPNGRDVPELLPRGARSRYRGVMLTSLTRRKQITHAIKAMTRVGRVRFRRVTLDVFGDGDQRKRLEQMIESSKAPVQLRGYSDHAMEEFENASFSLLTSNNEAFGLVVIESMARGCIPISYDMPYGPADIITHGVDGFLVPLDDVWGVATWVRRIAQTKPSELQRIREAAHRRAMDFNDENVTARWSSVMTGALERRRTQVA